jgi:hypothetical protein
MIGRVLRAKWNVVRLAAAAFLLWVVLADTPARLARLQYASLPEFDAAGEIRYLRSQGRYGEAVMVAEAALRSEQRTANSEHEEGGHPVGSMAWSQQPAARVAEIEAERRKTLDEQSSYLRRAGDLGLGAISGTGGSLERLVGAVAADFFVVGDVRDLVIQGGRLVIDGETDEVILILSGVGLATTIAPEVDWVPAILKAARKAGTLTKGISEFIVRAARAGDWGSLRGLLGDVRKLSQRASPGGTMRLLRHADTPEDVAALARFVERQPGGAFALHVTGADGAALIKRSGRTADAAAEQAVMLAARKGTPGVAWLRTGAYRTMVRPHVLVGVAKAFYKGNASELAQRIAATLDPRARWLIPLLAAWVFVELALLFRRFRRRDASPSVAGAVAGSRAAA